MKVTVKSYFTGSVLFELETESLKKCLEVAVLSGADLRDAVLRGADLRGAVLSGAVLSGAVLSGADQIFATDEESIEHLDAVREIIIEDQARLNMGHWHGSDEWVNRTCAEEAVCGTTHCLAGWLQVCATDPKVRSKPAHIAGVIQAPIAAKMFHRGPTETLAWLTERKYVTEIVEHQARRAAKAEKP